MLFFSSNNFWERSGNDNINDAAKITAMFHESSVWHLELSCRQVIFLLFRFGDQTETDRIVSSLSAAAFTSIAGPAGIFVGVP